MMVTPHLFIPGPTTIPDAVRMAMNLAMEDMRSPEFPKFTLPIFEDLKKVFKMKDGRVFIFPSSGTGAWESAITNTLAVGDKVLMSRFGQFSLLWVDMAERLGLKVVLCDEEWGTGVPLEKYADILTKDKNHEIKAVFATHNETATGVSSDIAGVRKALDAAKHPALLMVDAVSSLASIDFRMDEWGVDLCVAGSQKGLMLPAGLGIVCVSPKALAAREQSTQPRCYFDFGEMLKANASGYFPYTPSLPLLHGLRESLTMIMEEGLDQIFHRHHYLASGVRAAIQNGWKLDLCAKAPKWYSDTVSAIVVPEGINSAHVIDVAFRRYNLALGAGLSKVAGKVFRIGHLGDLNELMLIGALGGAEMAMLDVGIRIEPGSGVAAAMKYWRGNDEIPKKRVARSEVVYASQSTGSTEGN